MIMKLHNKLHNIITKKYYNKNVKKYNYYILILYIRLIIKI